MMAKNGGIPVQTLSDWVTKESEVEGVRQNEPRLLKLPSGTTFRVSAIIGLDNNEYLVLEVSEWVAVAADILKTPKNKKKPTPATLNNLVDFLSWFAVKGFYADAYANLKGAYTEADSRA